MDTTVYLLVVLSNADGAVKGAMCTRDNLLQHLDCLRRLQPPHLVEVRRNWTNDEYTRHYREQQSWTGARQRDGGL